MLMDTQKLVAPEGFRLKFNVLTHGLLISIMKSGLKTVFFIIVMNGLCAKLVEFTLYPTVETSFWESLLNA